MTPRKENTYSIIIFILTFLIDYLSKYYALGNTEIIYNQGVAFGLFSEVPRVFQTLTLSIAFSLFFFVFVLTLSFLPTLFSKLKYSSALFTGAALGNVVDRLIDGKTIDFIPMGNQIYFNLADLFLILGLILCIIEIIKHKDSLWFPQDLRKKFYVDKDFQISFLYRILFLGGMISLVIFIFSFIFLWMTLDLMDLHFSSKLLSNYVLSYFFLMILLMIILAGFSFVFSHRIIGPLFALKRYINHDSSCKSNFTLRKGDELQNITNKIVEDVYQQIKTRK